MAQILKRFCQGIDFGGRVNNERVEDQINDFLAENPTYVARDINIVLGPNYKEAYVIFDIKDQKKDWTKDIKSAKQSFEGK
mgnify:CR=1 FL=1